MASVPALLHKKTKKKASQKFSSILAQMMNKKCGSGKNDGGMNSKKKQKNGDGRTGTDVDDQKEDGTVSDDEKEMHREKLRRQLGGGQFSKVDKI